MTQRLLVATAVAVALVVALTAAAFTLPRDGDRHPMGGGRMTGSATTSEAAYLVEMVAHHEEAVTAAQELSRSDRPEMRVLGRSIVESQTTQIELMTGWLERWHPGAGPADYEPMMRDLTALDGDELDRTFLEDMVGHHMMAVMTSQHLLMAGGDVHAEVADLAGVIRDEQRREIVIMTGWLREWFDASWRGHHGSGHMSGHMTGRMMR
ncbi:MAG: DUF305 domain-containing protein [Nocardioides sp.]|nr:DUF305 domain-containing protein [Nocardioides sp.]